MEVSADDAARSPKTASAARKAAGTSAAEAPAARTRARADAGAVWSGPIPAVVAASAVSPGCSHANSPSGAAERGVARDDRGCRAAGSSHALNASDRPSGRAVRTSGISAVSAAWPSAVFPGAVLPRPTAAPRDNSSTPRAGRSATAAARPAQRCASATTAVMAAAAAFAHGRATRAAGRAAAAVPPAAGDVGLAASAGFPARSSPSATVARSAPRSRYPSGAVRHVRKAAPAAVLSANGASKPPEWRRTSACVSACARKPTGPAAAMRGAWGDDRSVSPVNQRGVPAASGARSAPTAPAGSAAFSSPAGGASATNASAAPRHARGGCDGAASGAPRARAWRTVRPCGVAASAQTPSARCQPGAIAATRVAAKSMGARAANGTAPCPAAGTARRATMCA